MSQLSQLRISAEGPMHRRSARLLVGAIMVMAAGSVWLSRTAGRHARPQLQLDEISSRTLPDSFDVKGAHVSPDGTALLWAVNQPYLILEDENSRRIVRSNSLERPVAAVLIQDDTVVEAIDADRRSVIRLSLTGRLIAEQPLGLPWQVESAVHTASGWSLGGRDVAGNYRVVAFEESGARTRLLTVPAREHRGTQLSMSLSAAEGGLFATLRSRPHTVTRVTEATAAAVRVPSSGFAAPRLPTGEGNEAPLWLALEIYPLDKGYIRTFSDLRSDLRVLATYDAEGRFLQRSVIAVPIGILATVPEKRVLLAARRTDRLEVVTYRWRWGGVHFEPGDLR